MSGSARILLRLSVLVAFGAEVAVAAEPLPAIRVSDNGRYFAKGDGVPFFWLGDTAWCIFNHPSPEDVDLYLNDRAGKGFNVIQGCVAIWDWRTRRNPDGQVPFSGNDPTAINKDYFKNVDAIVDKAAARGMYIAMLPFWTKNTRTGPFAEPAGMKAYCAFLGERYAPKNVFFVLGGDTAGRDIQPVIDAEAEGLLLGAKKAGVTKIMITYHPTGRQSSSFWFQERPWLDFNSIQSGHFIQTTNFQIVGADWEKTPTKPTLDMEPGYENITDNLVRNDPGAPRIQAVDVRRSAYLAVFAGAAGHTYGNGEVYEFYHPPANGAAPAGNAGWHAPMEWKDALKLPASGQVQYVRYLMESRPPQRVPDQSLVVGLLSAASAPATVPGVRGRGPRENALTRIAAIRGEDGSYAFIYLPDGITSVEVRTGSMKGETLRGWWYNPRNGEASKTQDFAREERLRFVIPKQDGLHPMIGEDDWVLVLDDVSKNYAVPGKRAAASGQKENR